MIKINDDTVINLKPKEAALVMGEDGETQIFIPNIEDDTTVPLHIQFLVAVIALANDDKEDFISTTLTKFNKIIEDAKNDLLEQMDDIEELEDENPVVLNENIDDENIDDEDTIEIEADDWWYDPPTPKR